MQNNLTKVLIVGLGDLGAELARKLLAQGMQVLGVKRSGIKVDDNIKIINADVTQPESLLALAMVKPDIIIYCVAASGQSDAEYKAAYVDGLRNTLATQKNNAQLKHVFFVSSTRVYGQDVDSLLDETVAAIPADFGGERLLEAEALLAQLQCGASALRLSGIYGPGRLRMLNLAKSANSWPQQNTWSNRIHRDDAAAFIVFLCKQVLAKQQLENCYIVTDCMPVPQYTVLSWIADTTKTTKPIQLPVTGGKRLSNQRLLATGFKLQYPEYQVGYGALLALLNKPSSAANQ
jgi:nucleoside-diphosphate-sugar epimerase